MPVPTFIPASTFPGSTTAAILAVLNSLIAADSAWIGMTITPTWKVVTTGIPYSPTSLEQGYLVVPSTGGLVLSMRSILTGLGLMGGGDLSADRTIDLRLNATGGLSRTLGGGANELGITATGVVSGSYTNTSLTVNALGLITNASSGTPPVSTTINPTDGVLPYRLNGTAFADSPVTRINATTIQVAAINGGSTANDDITIQGTSHATRVTSYVNLQPNGGLAGIGLATPLGKLHVKAASASEIACIIEAGAVSPTAMLQEWRNSSGVVVISVGYYSASGGYTFSSNFGKSNTEVYGFEAFVAGSGTGCCVFGKGARITGVNSIAIGNDCNVIETGGNGTIALGQFVTTNGSGNIVIGNAAGITGNNAIAIGVGNSISGSAFMAIGNSNSSTTFQAKCLGQNCTANHASTMLIGQGLTSQRRDEFVIGADTQSGGTGGYTGGFQFRITQAASDGNDYNCFLITNSWIVATLASRTARTIHKVSDFNADREYFRAEADGSTPKIGYFAVTAVGQQIAAALINNVTSGGSSNVIDDYSDLLIYANDAVAIRNNIYQLARKLDEITAGLRAFGLFA